MFLYLFLLFLLQTKVPVEESRKKIWLVDSKVVEGIISFHGKLLFSYSFIFKKKIDSDFLKYLFILLQGLIVSSRKNSLQHFKKPWAHEHEPVNSLLEAAKVSKYIRL